MARRSQHKLLLTRDLHTGLSSAADKGSVSMSDIVRQELTAIASGTAPDCDTNPVKFLVTADDDLWEQAETQARAQGLSLSAAMRLRLASRVQV